MNLESFHKLIEHLPLKQEVKFDMNATPNAILSSSADDLVTVCEGLHKNPETYFDMLSCVTGIDNGPEAKTMEVAYNLYSIPFNLHLMIRSIYRGRIYRLIRPVTSGKLLTGMSAKFLTCTELFSGIILTSAEY